MSVFDAEVKIGRTVKDPGTDHSLPPAGSLSFGAIKGVSALSGTTGVDACLITGNKWQQLNGKHTENVTMDHLLNIFGNRQELVAGNHMHTIVGTTNNTHVGIHNHTNVAPRNDTFINPRTETHSEPEHQHQPTGRNEVTSSECTHTDEGSHVKLKDWMIYDVKFEATNVNAEIKNLSVDGTFFNIEDDKVHMHFKEAALKVRKFISELHAVKLKAAGSHVKAIGADLNAGVAANADSPFA